MDWFSPGNGGRHADRFRRGRSAGWIRPFYLGGQSQRKISLAQPGEMLLRARSLFEIWLAVDSLDEVFFLFSREKAAFLAFLLSKNHCLLLYNLF